MHVESLLHVRDHANRDTGEAFELTVDRLADRLDVTPQWVRRLLNTLIASGELIIQRSRGRHPNVYVIPYARCPACQEGNPKLKFPVDLNPKRPALQPETLPPATQNSHPSNPKLGGGSQAPGAQIAPLKEVKDLKEKKEGPTRHMDHDRLERRDDPRDESPYVHIHRDDVFQCASCGTKHATRACPTWGSGGSHPAAKLVSG